MGQRQPTLSEEVKADDNSLDMQKIEHLSKPTSLDMARSSQNDWTLDKAHSQKSSSMSLPESLNKRGWSCTEGSHTRESIELDAQLWRQQKKGKQHIVVSHCAEPKREGQHPKHSV